ncbi:hypothetical protein PoB_004611400 [Plakobranchus ocellatus]|uniref:Uncharacterized protein n=1 Tax=Plakobranchus ocellatus TaxID=259542 RepID=A0AAV4BHP1_9GAST|nr:hypothetical protein PoB_004611400 [Plakobranchus ocellatus]
MSGKRRSQSNIRHTLRVSTLQVKGEGIRQKKKIANKMLIIAMEEDREREKALRSGGLSLLMFIATAVLAHGISKLGESVAVREAGLHFGHLQTALVFGLVLAMLLAISVAFSICHYTRKDHIMFRDSRSMADLPDDIPT